jgi:hypothetical protein
MKNEKTPTVWEYYEFGCVTSIILDPEFKWKTLHREMILNKYGNVWGPKILYLK